MKDEIFSDSILTEMYNKRIEDFYYKVIKKYGECESENEEEKLRNRLTELIKQNVKEEECIDEILDVLDNLETAYKNTNDWWEEKCYKAGIVDGMSFNVETDKFRKLLDC